MPHSVASEMGLHCLPVTNLGVSSLKRVKYNILSFQIWSIYSRNCILEGLSLDLSDSYNIYWYFFFSLLRIKKTNRYFKGNWCTFKGDNLSVLFRLPSEKWSTLTCLMLNKLRCHAHFFPANQITWSEFLIEIHIFNDKQCRSRSVGCLLRQGM